MWEGPERPERFRGAQAASLQFLSACQKHP